MCHLQYLIIYDMVKVNVYQVWDFESQHFKAWYTSAIGTVHMGGGFSLTLNLKMKIHVTGNKLCISKPSFRPHNLKKYLIAMTTLIVHDTNLLK